MIKEIKYNGFSASPSDYDSLDGDLACSLGIVKEDNAVKPVLPPSTVLSLSSGQRVISIHRTPTFEHYLVVDDLNRLYWRTKDNSLLTPIKDFADKKLLQVECIGNTILALSNEGIYYALWKHENLNYSLLGNKIPECPISFGLQGTPVISDEFDISYNEIPTMNLYGSKFSKENKGIITEQILSKVNSFVAEQATSANRFMFPFFVRYAYRLYDGSLSHHSAPILMMPTTSVNPIVTFVGTAGTTSSKLKVAAIAAELDYMPVAPQSTFEDINRWSDIIRSVDVFISAPIYTYNQSGEVEEFLYGAVGGYFYGKCNDSKYEIHNIKELCQGKLGSTINYSAKLPAKTADEVNDEISNCAQFYHVASINIEDLMYERKKLELSKGVLQSLTARELMSDDYQTHDTLIPSTMFVYNQRINIANIERKMFKGYDTASMVCYINQTDGATTGNAYIYTKLSTSDGVYRVLNDCSFPLSLNPRVFPYLFYPDTCATQMLVNATGAASTETDPYLDIALTPHSFLNGSFYFNGFSINESWWPKIPLFQSSQNPIVSLRNKIYTSEVNNPFRFPLEGINTVGVGEIIGISTAAKALSEGQFGQYPLYAFTSEGVWALEVSNKGTYSARQPITRDVCLNTDCITQIDSAVLFITERGVMLLSGSNSTCISDILDSYDMLSMPDIPRLSAIIEDSGFTIDSFNFVPFREYIKNAKMIYDYVNQHIILYNSTLSYAYVYSLDSKSWGMIACNIVSAVNSYPQAYAMSSDNNLVDYTQNDITRGLKGMLLTRPIKLDNPDELKTVNTVIQRGHFSKGSVQSILYGSRDLINWRLIASSKDHYLRGFSGTPYKYFRIALICNLEDKESISGCSIQYIPKLTNKLR